MAANPELCSILDWDGAFFGVTIARVNTNRLDVQTTKLILDWCRDNAVRCLYLLADSNHFETLRLAERNGFYLTDIRMTFEHTLPTHSEAGPAIRFALPEDTPVLRAMASSAYQDTRFYYDGHFSQELCSRLYVTWIEKSMNGYAQAVLVTGDPGQPTGFVTCHTDDATGAGRIGLVGVGENTRGRGVGQTLIKEALGWFYRQGMKSVQVSTQGRNIGAQRLYQKCNFLTREVKFWYHRWFAE